MTDYVQLPVWALAAPNGGKRKKLPGVILIDDVYVPRVAFMPDDGFSRWRGPQPFVLLSLDRKEACIVPRSQKDDWIDYIVSNWVRTEEVRQAKYKVYAAVDEAQREALARGETLNKRSDMLREWDEWVAEIAAAKVKVGGMVK